MSGRVGARPPPEHSHAIEDEPTSAVDDLTLPPPPTSASPETIRAHSQSAPPSIETEVAEKAWLPLTGELTIPTLTIIAGAYAGRCFALKDTTIVGRGRTADLRVDDSTISRSHAAIKRIAGAYRIEDLGSRNGTFVGGAPVRGSPLLRSGDRVQFGPHVVMRFSLTDHTEESLQRRLYESSTRDELTGAFNRKYLFDRLEGEVAHVRRHAGELSLLMIDLDHFKTINDHHGHVAGDAVLRAVGHLVTTLIRTDDIFARYGGEEFAVLARATSKENATTLARRICKAVTQITVNVSSAKLRVTVSVGVAALAELGAGGTALELVQLADDRLYEAKRLGRDRVCDAG